MNFKKTIQKIQNLEIQGATNIAKAAVKGISKQSQKIKTKSTKEYLKEITKLKKELFKSRPTEPEMRNYLNYITYNLNKSKNEEVKELKKLTKEFCKNILNKREKNFKKLTKYGSKLVKKNYVVYTHCHSSSVTQSLLKVKNKFTVHNTETRPKFQGRKTAKELAKKNIKVYHYVDSGMKLALKKSDIVLLGADSITTTHFINKIGTSICVDLANSLNIPVYVFTSSYSFNPETMYGKDEVVEQRASNEVWQRPPKNVQIVNPAFEKVSLEKVTAIVSDLGILQPETFIQELLDNPSWKRR